MPDIIDRRLGQTLLAALVVRDETVTQLVAAVDAARAPSPEELEFRETLEAFVGQLAVHQPTGGALEELGAATHALLATDKYAPRSAQLYGALLAGASHFQQD